MSHLLFPKDLSWKKFLVNELTKDVCSLNQIEGQDSLSLIRIESVVNIKNTQIAFALDAIPETTLIKEDSIGNQSLQILNHIESLIEINLEERPSLTLQVFGISEKQGILHTGRCELVAQKLFKSINKMGAKCTRKFWDTDYLLKVLILPNREIMFGFYNTEKRASYSSLLSPFLGGFSTIADDKKAPSRAFKKLVESQKVLGRVIENGETVLDLGACPGGWSYVALNLGAKVTSIDRSELDPSIMHNSSLTFLKADAFKYEGEGIYDWVISDIICTPDRILELIDLWAVTKKCKNFVFTIKFKGDSDYNILTQFKDKLKGLTYQTYLRQLNVNKNEVMVLGTTKQNQP